MTIIGLTGSIGMGKTTTAKMFQELGCPVFDSDAAVHNLYKSGGRAVPLLKAVFPDVIKKGAVDRALLGAHMRKDPLNLQVLESFIHPMIADDRQAFLNKAQENKNSIVVFDVPLLFETGGDKNVDIVVVVTAPAEVQKKRVLSRAGMSEDLFESLLKRQMPDADKRRRADYLIYTDKGLDFAREQVQKIVSRITSEK